MASNQTENYGLNQWERTDKVLMEDFNADNAKIDAAIKAVDARVDGKADTSALDALARTVSGHTTSLSKLGNCRIQYFTVDFNQSSGGPVSVTFSGKPELFLMAGNGFYFGSRYWTNQPLYYAVTASMTYGHVNLSWNGNVCTFDAASKLSGFYHVIAFYREDNK